VTLEAVLSVALFAFVTSITPGPNNTMLLASGANFGFGRTFPHMLGINLGFPAMLIAIGLGAGLLFAAVPALSAILYAAGAAYLIYLAWRLATADPSAPPNGSTVHRPLTFVQAAAFQWVNPKAWMIALSAASTYAGPHEGAPGVFSVAALFAFVNLPCIAVWAAAGAGMRGFLSKPGRLRTFNVVMALLLVGSLAMTVDLGTLLEGAP
jgi:threonine/homoserine/homoserine lactone efflux protein